MKYEGDLTAEYARKIIKYNPETGDLHWKARTPDMFEDSPLRTAEHECALWNSRLAGKPAGSPTSDGYIKIKVSNRFYRAHRVIWLYMTGEWPIYQIDHRDTNRTNNIWENLREATSAQNAANRRCRADSTVGIKGVQKNGDKWKAHITNKGNILHLGTFDTLESAANVRAEAATKYHGDFARVA